MKQYHPKVHLDREEFDDIFSPILNLTDQFFKIIQERGKADFLQAIIAIVLFTEGSFDDKILFTFQIFDTD